MQDPGPSTSSSSSPSTTTSASTSGGSGSRNRNHLSQINIPIFLTQAEITNLVRSKLPSGEIYKEENNNRKIYVNLEGTPTISFSGQSMTVSLVMGCWARKLVLFGQGPHAECKVRCNFTINLGVNSDCTLTATVSGGFQWLDHPVIHPLGIRIDLTGKAEPKIKAKINSLASDIQAKIAEKIQIKPKVLKLWNKISEPREISDNVYLQLNPRELQLSPLTAVGDKLVTHVGLTSQPLLVAGSQPPAQSAAVQQLPALTTNPTSLAADQFDITITSKIDFTRMQAELNKHLANKDYPVSYNKTGFFKLECKFHIDSFSVQRQDNTDNIEVTVNVSGKYTGKFVLKGKPVYDAENNVVKFDNFDYVADNFKFFSKIKFIDLGFHKKIAKKIREKLTFELDKPLNKLQDRGNLKLNELCFGDHLQLNINLDQLQPVGIVIENNSVVAGISLKGTSQAKVNVQKPAKGPSR